MFVSIILPTYNRAHCLKKCIDSVLNQSHKNLELIVIDNSSTDGTDELIKKYSDPRIHFYKINNQGKISASRNLGIIKSSGDYIAFIDSDDVWSPLKLTHCIEAMGKSRSDFCFTGYNRVGSQGRRRVTHKFIIKKKRTGEVKRILLEDGNIILPSTVVINRKVLLQAGLFNERDYIIADDFDLWIRISEITDRYCYLGMPLTDYYVEEDSDLEGNTSRIEYYKHDIEIILKKYILGQYNPSYYYVELAMYGLIKKKYLYSAIRILYAVIFGRLSIKKRAISLLWSFFSNASDIKYNS